MLGEESQPVDPTPDKPVARAREVVIAGGGVAALETALALHVLAGGRVRLTLVSPMPDFVYRPVSVLEPFVLVPPRRLALSTVAAELGATLVVDAVASVDTGCRVVLTAGGRELPYDALVIALGAKAWTATPAAIRVDGATIGESLRPLVEEVERGSIDSVAFVAPQATWPLIAYELALLLRGWARERKAEIAVTVITADDRPVQAFGETVSDAVVRALEAAGVDLIAGTRVEEFEGALIFAPGGSELRFDRVVGLPSLSGPSIPGLPVDADGFLPIDANGAVRGVEDVYAAGDATDFPVKFGGVAARQADAVAREIAVAAGADVLPRPFDGTVHGVLLGGRESGNLYFSVRFEGGFARESHVSAESESGAWSPDAKIEAVYLGAYLDERWANGPRWRVVVPAQ